MRAVGLAVASGLMLAASMPGFELAPLAWVGLVPLLFAIEDAAPGRAFRLGWLAGTTFFVSTCYWITYTIGHYTALPMLLAAVLLVLMSMVLGAYTGAFAAMLRWLALRRLPAVWLAPLVWAVLEWMRGWVFIGFPWAPLAVSQYRCHDLVQIIEVTGVHGLSAVIIFVNVVVGAVLSARGTDVRRHGLALGTATVLLAALVGWGGWRVQTLRARPMAGHATVGIAQGNVPQDQKWDAAFQEDAFSRYVTLTRELGAAKPDLIVWPETAAPFYFQDPTLWRERVLALVRETQTPLLFGSPAYRRTADGGFRDLNRAYLLSAAGEELGTYDKMQLVPFGEYVPFERVLFFVHQMVHATGALEAGIVPTVFRLSAGTFGAPICYEDVFPSVTRRFTAGGAAFLVNITNDAWYGRTTAPVQHLAQATLRAIEGRTPLVRAANTGISAIIDWDGRVRWQSGLFETVGHVGEIAWPGVRTVYTRVGEGFVGLCVLAVVAALAAGWRRRL